MKFQTRHRVTVIFRTMAPFLLLLFCVLALISLFPQFDPNSLARPTSAMQDIVSQSRPATNARSLPDYAVADESVTDNNGAVSKSATASDSNHDGKHATDVSDNGVARNADSGTTEDHPSPNNSTSSDDNDGIDASESCLPHIVFDKPVKTGSTAVTFAIRSYIQTRNEPDRKCTKQGCIDYAEQLCNGTYPEKDMFSLIGHLKGTDGRVTRCLREKGYYSVTSIRDPVARWTSAFLFNRHLKSNHYGIPHTLSFSDFMDLLPRCMLYHYYDNLGGECNATSSVQERLENIVARHDEVIDLYDEPVGVLHKRIARYVNDENVSSKPKDEFREPFNKHVLDEEYMLYNRLREIRLRKPNPARMPC